MERYQIKDLTNRNNTDLTQHTVPISNSIVTIAGESLVPGSIHISREYFEFEVTEAFSDKNSRLLGKKIVSLDSALNLLVKEYRYTRSNGQPAISHQLFERF